MKNGKIVDNVFDRGAVLNIADFFDINLCGKKPTEIDWRYKLEYSPEFKSPVNNFI